MRKVYLSPSHNPLYNLAAEDCLFAALKPGDEILYLWQNERTVVIGRNQNPWKECDIRALEGFGGTLVRRRSGGGAVYHDLGNLNYTFLSNASETTVSANTAIILSALEGLGMDARFSGRNDILIDGMKISGCAHYAENGFLCHHGTLLVDTCFTDMARVLRPSLLKLESKGIDSVRARVTNLKSIDSAITVAAVIDAIHRAYCPEAPAEDVRRVYPEYDPPMASIINQYGSPQWIFGESPEFDTAMDFRFPWGEVDLYLRVQDGIITEAKIDTDALDVSVPTVFAQKIIGESFNRIESRIQALGEALA